MKRKGRETKALWIDFVSEKESGVVPSTFLKVPGANEEIFNYYDPMKSAKEMFHNWDLAGWKHFKMTWPGGNICMMEAWAACLITVS